MLCRLSNVLIEEKLLILVQTIDLLCLQLVEVIVLFLPVAFVPSLYIIMFFIISAFMLSR